MRLLVILLCLGTVMYDATPQRDSLVNRSFLRKQITAATADNVYLCKKAQRPTCTINRRFAGDSQPVPINHLSNERGSHTRIWAGELVKCAQLQRKKTLFHYLIGY